MGLGQSQFRTKPLRRNLTKKVGFTGTRVGMTDRQRAVVIDLLLAERAEIVYHGGCVGADTEFDCICYYFFPRGITTVIHPSNKKEMQGRWHYTLFVMPEKHPLDRNRDIVDESDFLIATPKEDKEMLRSGTWATIRYARKNGKPIYIVYPDGSLAMGLFHGKKEL